MDAIRRFRNKNGQILSIRVRTYPKRNETGELVRLIGSFEDVTLSEQNKNEKAKQDELFQSVFQLSLDAIIFYNHNTGNIFFNAAAQTVFNAGTKEALIQYFKEYIPELIHKEAPDSIYREAHKMNNIYLFTKTDNTRFWGNIIFSNLNQDGEEITYIRITDINDLKMAEEKIREKEYNLRTLLDSRNAPVWMIDRNYRIIDYNTRFAENFYGLYKIELRRGMILAVETPENQYNSIYKTRYDKALSGEVVSFQEVHYFNGKNIVFEVSMYPIKSSDKEDIIGVAVFTEDVTIREENNERMIAQEQLISTITQNISEGIYRAKRSGEIVYANESFAKLMGYESVAELLKEGNFRDFYQDKGIRERLWERLDQDGSLSNVEIQIVRKDESVFWVGMSSRKILSRNEEVLVDGVIRDLTDIKNSEAKLMNQNQELQKVVAELDRIIHSISHEFRAPLNSLQGLISLLEMEQDEKQRTFYYSLMHRSLKNLDAFLQDTLNYSFNLSAELNPEEIDLKEVLNTLFQQFQIAANRIDQEIDFGKEDNYHPPFIADKRRIDIILKNLISNSIKYSFPGRTPKVTVKVVPASDFYKIQISDNGIGIEEKYHESIFKMFFRISPKNSGSGLGLYLVKEAMNKLNGTISVKSVPGEGTTFTLFIPNHTESVAGKIKEGESPHPLNQNSQTQAS
ncbi:MAG: PAS domain S-box protein [Bacteroidia bacterium]|nr:PAS domain S-box protein [Bacteroidia bacterium]